MERGRGGSGGGRYGTARGGRGGRRSGRAGHQHPATGHNSQAASSEGTAATSTVASTAYTGSAAPDSTFQLPEPPGSARTRQRSNSSDSNILGDLLRRWSIRRLRQQKWNNAREALDDICAALGDAVHAYLREEKPNYNDICRTFEYLKASLSLLSARGESIMFPQAYSVKRDSNFEGEAPIKEFDSAMVKTVSPYDDREGLGTNGRLAYSAHGKAFCGKHNVVFASMGFKGRTQAYMVNGKRVSQLVGMEDQECYGKVVLLPSSFREQMPKKRLDKIQTKFHVVPLPRIKDNWHRDAKISTIDLLKPHPLESCFPIKREDDSRQMDRAGRLEFAELAILYETRRLHQTKAAEELLWGEVDGPQLVSRLRQTGQSMKSGIATYRGKPDDAEAAQELLVACQNVVGHAEASSASVTPRLKQKHRVLKSVWRTYVERPEDAKVCQTLVHACQDILVAVEKHGLPVEVPNDDASSSTAATDPVPPQAALECDRHIEDQRGAPSLLTNTLKTTQDAMPGAPCSCHAGLPTLTQAQTEVFVPGGPNRSTVWPQQSDASMTGGSVVAGAKLAGITVEHSGLLPESETRDVDSVNLLRQLTEDEPADI